MGLIVTGLLGGLGAVQEGFAKAQAEKYNAAVASMNAMIAKQNAAMAGQSGAAQSGIQSQKTRSMVGEIKANQAAGGIDVNSGSASDVQQSAQQLGKLDALTIRSNAAKEAYGYQVQSKNFETESALDKYAASNDLTAGWLSGAGTLLGDMDKAASEIGQFMMAG